MRQTAVEWLVQELTRQNMFMHLFAKEIEQAKEKEKEQIKNAWMCGKYLFKYSSSEQHYNETFKQKQNGSNTNE